jgi:hypothetical protein
MDFHPRRFMMNLCRSSDSMQLHTRQWPPIFECLAGGLRTKSNIQIPPDVIDNAILQALNQTPFALVRELVKSIYISRATVWRCLIESLGFIIKHLHWPGYPADSCAVTNSNRSIKRIAQTLRVCTGQSLAKFSDLGCVLVLFVGKPRKGLGSSGSTTPETVKYMISQSTH